MTKFAALSAVFFGCLTQRVVATKLEITANGQVVGANNDFFAKADLNNDGFISLAEFAHYQNEMGLRGEMEHKAAKWDCCDSEGYGCGNFVNGDCKCGSACR